ncbi:HAMP domain-containing sensor histidine kinase [Alcaligenaceae bacterium B3P038]|nr:HAMP domain-containing sensor histidine kinase [Alcaligenaceae bacterium B3P038]
MMRLSYLLRGLWSSVSFRLTLNYSVLAVSTALLLLAFFYVQTVDVLTAQFSRQITVTAQRLSSHFDRGGRVSLIDEINLELADSVDSDTEIFLLLGPQNAILAGNLDLVPPFDATDDATFEHNVVRGGVQVRGLMAVRPLSDGTILLVGLDIRDMQHMQRRILNASLLGAAMALLMVVGGTFLFRRTLQRRVEIIRHTAKRIGAGELTRRVPLQHREDEFALLTDDINDMLDRIERLMTGVRNVSDSAAHNLRTPLARVLSRLRTAASDRASADDLRAANTYAIAELDNLIVVFEKLLEIAEAESGAQRKRFERCHLDAIARDVVDLYEAVAEDQRITLRYDGHRAVQVMGDADLLAGAIANLVENALKYAGVGAVVTLTAEVHQNVATLAVCDNGPGVPATKRSRLGERFYRASEGGNGFGLGLASVTAVARLHGGALKIEDAAPGLRVAIALPAAPITEP